MKQIGSFKFQKLKKIRFKPEQKKIDNLKEI